MATPGERFKKWVDDFAVEVKDRLRGWMTSWLSGGLLELIEGIEPEAIDTMSDVMTRIKEDPNTPDDIRAIIDKVITPGKPIPLLVMIPLAIIVLAPMLFSLSQPLGKLAMYPQDRKLHSFRLDPAAVITAWRRDPEKYADLFDDLKDLGWNDDRIEVLKFVTLFMPSPQDLVTWQAKEVFEPEMIERYGLDDEFGQLDLSLFEKLGVTEEQAKNYWRAHWEHASYMQIREMLHRGVLSLAKEMPAPPTTKAGWEARDAEGAKAMYDWYRLVEIPPFWRDKLTEMAFEIPTRVDVRRWWDMRTISEERLRSIYHAQGYHGEDLEDYLVWTKVYVAFPDLLARWTNGYITEDEVKSELTTLGMPADRVDELMETKIKAVKGEKTAAERALTKTDIIKGVKTGVITRGEGEEFLMDLNYDEDEATFILDINIPADETEPVVKQRELTKTDIINGLKTEIITEAEARTRLIELRYSPGDADFLLKIYRAVISPPTETRDKEASKADILLAVKKGLITPEDGYLMLLDLGFTPEAAQFILAVRAETSPFSPVSYSEFKDLTHKYRIASGMEAKEMPEELKKAADEVVRLTKDVEALKLSIEEEEKGLIKEEVLPAAATARRDELRVTLHRAEAELERVKSEYEKRIAEWRHGK